MTNESDATWSGTLWSARGIKICDVAAHTLGSVALPPYLVLMDEIYINNPALAVLPSTSPPPFILWSHDIELRKYLDHLFGIRLNAETRPKRCGLVRVNGRRLFIWPPQREGDTATIVYWHEDPSAIAPPVPIPGQLHVPLPAPAPAPVPAQPTAAAMHPSLLSTNAQQHSNWVFGGIAELVDNARDAGATRLSVLAADELGIPALCLDDNGGGMDHAGFLRMFQIGHELDTRMDVGEKDLKIGRYGVGFKTGTMRVGNDCVVFTKRHNTCSVGMLSQTYNNTLTSMRTPIVTYKLPSMEIDESMHTLAEAEANMKVIQAYSPFNERKCGAELEKIKKTGTRVWIYNLRKQKSSTGQEEYELKWHAVPEEAPNQGLDPSGADVYTAPRARRRPGQMAEEVKIDYSFRAYLEVLFKRPRMKMFVQRTLVRPRRLEKEMKDRVLRYYGGNGQSAPEGQEQVAPCLTVGYSEREKQEENCGVMLYWRGRLIDAFMRVGTMQNNERALGVIGIFDASDILTPLNNKQKFEEDTPEFMALERWLARMMDAYVDDKYDAIRLGDLTLRPRQHLLPAEEWVQCDKCGKWRKLSVPLTKEEKCKKWFCQRNPDKRFASCEAPEEEEDCDVFVTNVQRDTHTALNTPTTPATAPPRGVLNLPVVSRTGSGGLSTRAVAAATTAIASTSTAKTTTTITTVAAAPAATMVATATTMATNTTVTIPLANRGKATSGILRKEGKTAGAAKETAKKKRARFDNDKNNNNNNNNMADEGDPTSPPGFASKGEPSNKASVRVKREPPEW